MRRLAGRIRAQGGHHEQAQAARRAAPDSLTATAGGQGSPSGPGVMPLAAVLVYPQPGGDYVTVAYRDLAPVFTADGAAVPSTSPGRWAQLVAAGNPAPGAQRRHRAPIAGG